MRELLDLAADHNVLGLALSALVGASRRGEAPDSVTRRLDRLLRSVRRRTAVFELKRDLVVAALADAGVRPVVLKGGALAVTDYDEPHERHSADLDVLVREDRVESALRALGERGYAGPSSAEALRAYRRHHFHVPLRHPDSHVVEIHWALTRPSAVFRLDASEVMARATRLERPGQPDLIVPRPECTLLLLVLQNLQEGFSRLVRLVDIDRVVASTPGLDWDALVATARRGNLSSATAVSLRLANRLLGAAVPEGVIRALRPGRCARFHIAIMCPLRSLLAQRLRRADAARCLHELWLLDGMRERMLLLSQMLASDPAVTFPKLRPSRSWSRAGRIGKLFALQLYLYLEAAAAQATSPGRARIRFWSDGLEPGEPGHPEY